MNINYKRLIDMEELEKQLLSNPAKLVEEAENLYERQIKEIAEYVVGDPEKRQFVLLSGPSSSGKTTTAHKIVGYLNQLGKQAMFVSLDDFYIDNDKLPILPDGTKDYETIDAIEVLHFYRCFDFLIKNEIAEFPLFSFKIGKRLSKTKTVKLTPDTVLVIEGLHALNPRLTERIGSDRFIRLFITARSKFVRNSEMEMKIVIEPTNLRLCRRIIRDFNHRNSSLENTVNMWKSVRKGEKDYIHPHRDTAEIKVDSVFAYEIFLYRGYLQKILDKNVDMSEEKYDAINSILDEMSRLPAISDVHIPQTSLLREFID